MFDVAEAQKTNVSSVEANKSLSWKRLLSGVLFVGLGGTAAVLGMGAVGYRFSHIVADNVLINGRIVRITAPANGNIEAFYAKPGAEVKSGQVLARILVQPTLQELHQDQQLRLQLERAQDDKIRWQLEKEQLVGEVQSNATQLIAAKQTLDFLFQQLKTLDLEYKSVQGVDASLAAANVKQQKAELQIAVSKATEARNDYQRYQKLAREGAISEQQAEKLRFAFAAADAEVQQKQAALQQATAAFNASHKGLALSHQQNAGDGIAARKTRLQQSIQEQQSIINTLEAKIASGRQQIQRNQALSSTRLPAQTQPTKLLATAQEIKAPFAGVVYSTEREHGEQIVQSQPLLTLLDCQDVWMETVVKAEDANQIDTRSNVQVELLGSKQIIAGEVDMIQPISSVQNLEEKSKLQQVQALSPTIPSNLIGQSLARVTVKIPAITTNNQSQRFCGLGQSARLTFARK